MIICWKGYIEGISPLPFLSPRRLYKVTKIETLFSIRSCGKGSRLKCQWIKK